MKKTINALLLLAGLQAASQNVGIGTTTPHPSAKLEVTATDQGMLVPRLTSAMRAAIPSPAQGLLVFDTDTGSFWFFNGTAWINITRDPLTLPYYNEATASVPALTIMNNGSAAGIRGIGTTGPGLLGWGKSNGLAGVAIRADNTHASGIGFWSTTNSNDANAVFSNAGTGDLIRGFSGPSAGNLVYRVLNNGTLTTTGNVGIGTTGTPAARLEVNGNIKIADGTQGSNKVLTSDASGNASWQPASSPAATTFFQASKTGNTSTHDFLATLETPQTIRVSFPLEYADMGSNYNSTQHTYTIPSSGYYHFHATVTFDNSGGRYNLYFTVNGGIFKTASSNYSSLTGQNSIDIDYDSFFTAGQVIAIDAVIPANSTVALRNSSTFTGWKLF